MADDLLVSLFGGCELRPRAAVGGDGRLSGQHDPPPDAPVQPEPGLRRPGHPAQPRGQRRRLVRQRRQGPLQRAARRDSASVQQLVRAERAVSPEPRAWTIGSNNFATDHYQYDPSFSYAPSDYDVTHAFKVFGVWSPTIFKDSDSWAEKLLGGWTISGILNAHSGLPVDAGLQQHRLRRRLRGERLERRRLELRVAAGGVSRRRRNDYSIDAFRRRRRQLPQRRHRLLHRARAHAGAAVCRRRVGPRARRARFRRRRASERNSFRGPRYLNVDATLNKAFGLPAIRGLGHGAEARDPRRLLQPVQQDQPEEHPERHPERALRRSAGRARRADDRAAGDGSVSDRRTRCGTRPDARQSRGRGAAARRRPRRRLVLLAVE